LIIRALYARRYAGKIIAPATARDVVVAAQRLLYRLLAFCWALEESAAIRAVDGVRDSELVAFQEQRRVGWTFPCRYGQQGNTV
jgi:hypothetical protein